MAQQKHYTARIEITSTLEAEVADPQVRTTAKERKVTQIGSIVVRATELEKLLEKATAHLELVEED